MVPPKNALPLRSLQLIVQPPVCTTTRPMFPTRGRLRGTVMIARFMAMRMFMVICVLGLPNDVEIRAIVGGRGIH